jgi:HEAT repeat protein
MRPVGAALLLAAATLTGLALGGGGASREAAAAVGAEVHRSATGLRVAASGASLRAVLRELKPVAGISVDGLEHVAGSLTADFDLPLRAAIFHLLRDYSFLLIEGEADMTVRILGPTGTPGRAETTPPEVSWQPPRALWGERDVQRLIRAVGGEAASVLLEASHSPELEARMTAVSGLAQYGTEAMGFLAAAAIHDGDLAVRLAATRSLAGTGDTAIPHLLRVFREARDTDVRLTALAIVAASAGDVAEDIVALAARDPDLAVRERAGELSRARTSTSPPPAD